MALTLKMYMDESCHLQNDKTNTMALVTVYTIEQNDNFINTEINKIKTKYRIGGELKWNKVSNSNLLLYKEVITLLAQQVEQRFFRVRALLVRKDKTKIRKDYAEWYYKMAYRLFELPLTSLYESTTNNIDVIELYLDEKDGRSLRETKKLAAYLQNRLHGEKEVVGKVIDSTMNILIQLADIIAGALTYKERKLYTSKAKVALINQIEQSFNINLSVTSSMARSDFNLFVWSRGL